MATTRLPYYFDTLFELPDDYRREFQFSEPTSGFRCVIVATKDGLEITDSGDAGERTCSLCLDWMAESIAIVRGDLREIVGEDE